MYIPTPTLNDAASHILTARSTATTSSSTDYSSPGSIFGFVWFGLIGIAVLVGLCAAWSPILLVFAFPIFAICKLCGVTAGPSWKRRKQRRKAARAARTNRARELTLRRQVRQQWAREELQLARKEGRKPDLPPGRWIDDLEVQWKRGAQRLGFQDLPPELRLQIYSEFDYGAALNLMRVSKFFYNDRPADGVNREQRATFVYHAETFDKNRQCLACFGCLAIRETADFEESQRTGDFERFAKGELERRCFDCQIEKGEVRWLWWRRLVRHMKADTRGGLGMKR